MGMLRIESEARGCVGVGLGSFGVQGCHENSKNKCNSSEFDKNWGNTNGLKEIKTWTVGSTPVDFDQWGQESDFHPVPVK